MEKKSSSILTIILVFCLIISVVLNIILILKITGKLNINFNKSKQESASGVDYDRINNITLYINYSEQSNKSEQSVVLEKQKNTCNVSVYSKGYLDRSGEFSIDVFDDVINALRENDLSEYMPQTNENGQVVKGVLSYKLTVGIGREQTDLNASTVDAMDVIAKIITIGNNIQ